MKGSEPAYRSRAQPWIQALHRDFSPSGSPEVLCIYRHRIKRGRISR